MSETTNNTFETVLLRAVLEGAPPDEILRIGLDAKRSIWRRWVAIITDAGVVDALVMKHAQPTQWQWGVANPDAPQQTPTGALTPFSIEKPSEKPTAAPARKDKILALAREMIRAGREVVISTEIAERLRTEGDSATLHNLVIAVGNTLSRNGWRRVGDGEYELEEVTVS
jgi:hypothetical protein